MSPQKGLSLLNSLDIKKRIQLITEVQHQIQDLYNQIIVIKYGGSTLKASEFENTILDDISILHKAGVKPVIVHGGGPSITKEMNIRGMKPKFINGLRYTDKETLAIAEMVLSGKVNKNIVSCLNNYGVASVGISGKDGNTIIAEQKSKELGFVGSILRINTKLIDFLLNNKYVPVISPIGIGKNSLSYNINADDVAASIAISVGASRVIFVTDVGGVMKNGKLLPILTFDDVKNLIDDKIIKGGMIPKIEAMMKCFNGSVNKVYIVNGKKLHPIIGELFSDTGLGTMVVRS